MRTDTHPEAGIWLRQSELGKAMTAGRFWRWTAWGMSSLLGLSILGLLYLGAQPKWKPYYIELDNCSGSIRVVGAAPETVPLSQQILKTQVAQFVTGLRRISTDEELNKEQWRALEHQVTPKGKQKLLTYQQQYAPLLRVDPVALENLQVYQRTERTYLVRWTELVYNGKGVKRDLLTTTVYSGLWTFERHDPQTAGERQYAPAGVFFDEWEFQKETPAR